MKHVLALGAPLAAILAVAAAVLVGPQHPDLTLDEQAQIGVAEFETKKPAQGERTLRAVLAKDPDHPGALVGLALDAMQRGKEVEAQQYLDRAVQRAPGNFNVRMARAFFFNQRKDATRAQAEFEAAHRAAPSESGPVYNLAALAKRRGDLASARTLYAEYLKLAPGATDRQEVEGIVAELDRRLAGAH